MRFVETPIFTDEICSALEDDEYRALQSALLLRPEQGPVISGSGGLRKLRWRIGRDARGKRGGLRVIYYLGQIAQHNLHAIRVLEDAPR